LSCGIGVVGEERGGDLFTWQLAIGHSQGDDELGQVVAERGEGEVIEVDGDRKPVRSDQGSSADWRPCRTLPGRLPWPAAAARE